MTLAQYAPPLRRQVLDNGITVLALENATADIVAARIFVTAGSLYEPTDRAGLANLLAATLTKGTIRRSSLEIAELVEAVGASLSADASTDYFLVGLKTVTEDFEPVLALAAELIREPVFPEAEIELERSLAVQALRSQREQPFAVAFDRLRTAMYGGHPYGRSTLGSEVTLGRIERGDLQRFHRDRFRPEHVTIAISGCLTAAAAIALVEQYFGDWRGEGDAPGRTVSPAIAAPVPTIDQRHHMTPQDTQQAIVMLGYPAAAACDGTGEVHEDYAALKLLNTYLGNGLSSRLFVELREKRGLAYEVSAMYPTRSAASQFVAYMGTAPQNAAIALDGLRGEVERLKHEPLTADELQTSKNKLLGQYALGKQTNSQLAQLYGWYEVLGLGIEFDQEFQRAIDRVTVPEAQRVAQKYFDQPPVVSLVGPADAITFLKVA
ncbi:MAG: insulinase family protein [Cyanobacteria bacterium]|nr:insulinase family protein [Cyanobacteriota bacterium]